MAFINGKPTFFFPYGSGGSSDGGGGIIECDVLPTEEIKTDTLYKTPDGLFWYDTGWHQLINDDDIVKPGTNSSNPLGTAGLVRLYNKSTGLRLDDYNRLCVAAATQDEISEGISANKPLTPDNIKFAVQNKSYKGDFVGIHSTSSDKDTPASALAIKTFVENGDKSVRNFVLDNLLRFKMDYIEAGKSHPLEPGMIALILPYGDYTLSLHNGSSTVISNMGATMIFSAERDAENWNNDYWLAAVYVKKGTLGTPTVASTHNKYSSNLTIKNNYSGSSGSGRAYVYYLKAD